MLEFVLGVVLLLIGYAIWGSLTASTVKPDPSRPTPALTRADGVDFVAMPAWRVALVQLLNIAGLGPVFGPIMGALWGPQVFLWIVLGTILGGAVHDFLAGAMSVRTGGAGLPTLIGHTLGRTARSIATVFILLLLLLVGTVFVRGPAMLIVNLVPAEQVSGLFGSTELLQTMFHGQTAWMWLVMLAVFTYYILATMLPIDAIIGRFYPLLALALLIMVTGLAAAILAGRLPLPEFTLENLHPVGALAWPTIFITVSCGAVSGFHATQSPLMARCLSNEKYMKPVFYGAMVAEGFIALVWATAAQGFYGGVDALQIVLAEGGPGRVVHEICTSTLGQAGGILAVLGVIVLPITSGDTAFRVSRLIIADAVGLSQKTLRNRYAIALPLFAASLALNFVDFTLIWRYFGWANQTLAAVALWSGAVYLARRGHLWWIAALPAVFMTIVTTTYILIEERGLGLPYSAGVWLGLATGLLTAVAFLWLKPTPDPDADDDVPPSQPNEAEKAGDQLAC